ncbi:hypothetical protein [Kitasatospora sp. NPDC087315]|uniref:hypothetical protein n=1 Tax=Kitasatospora sp. NPDC087315 TaxID=3364069 RepID=UPI00380A1CE6
MTMQNHTLARAHRTLRRALNSASAGLACAVAYWDTAATGTTPDDRHAPTTVLFPDDPISTHIKRHNDGTITGTLSGPWGHIAAGPDQFERLADRAALTATIIRVARDNATTGGTP